MASAKISAAHGLGPDSNPPSLRWYRAHRSNLETETGRRRRRPSRWMSRKRVEKDTSVVSWGPQERIQRPCHEERVIKPYYTTCRTFPGKARKPYSAEACCVSAVCHFNLCNSIRRSLSCVCNSKPMTPPGSDAEDEENDMGNGCLYDLGDLTSRGSTRST